ncbi:Mitochondrial import inner membrane translocase subunit tim8 [Didymella keratinophila]|nr:Mitochondrial import inner membrane translocase subunit tim8 [Didymella keratinophila]
MDGLGGGLANVDVSRLSDADKQQLQQFAINEGQKARIQSSIHSLTDTCFRKCIPAGTIKNGKLDKYEEPCMRQCVDRFLDANIVVLRELESKSIQGHIDYFYTWYAKTPMIPISQAMTFHVSTPTKLAAPVVSLPPVLLNLPNVSCTLALALLPSATSGTRHAMCTRFASILCILPNGTVGKKVIIRRKQLKELRRLSTINIPLLAHSHGTVRLISAQRVYSKRSLGPAL